MKKFDVVRKAFTNQYQAMDVRGNVVAGPYDEKWQAQLYGTHWACAPSLVKRLKLKKVDGVLTGRPFGGVKVESLYKQPSGEWRAIVTVDGNRITYVANTRDKVLKLIAAHGSDIKTTRNILNPDSKEIRIERSQWGTCTDPGSEAYHCM